MNNNELKVTAATQEIKQVEGKYQHGFVSLELERADGVKISTGVQENFITPIGRQLDNNMGPGRLLSMGGDMFGLTHVSQCMTKYGGGTSSDYCVSAYDKTSLTLVLLNLGSGVNDIDEDVSSIYVHSDDGTVRCAKVVGYANGNFVQGADTKEGIIDTTKAEYAANKFYQVNRWKFDTGIATGTIDAVAMMPASVIQSNMNGPEGAGMSAWRCVDKVNVNDPNFISNTTAFCPPGIPGFTGNNGILLNYNNGGMNRHKLDLSTYEMLDLDVSEPWFVFPEDTSDWLIIGDYLYILRGSFRIEVYNKNTMAHVEGVTLSISNTIAKTALLYTGGKLYVTAITKQHGDGSALSKYSEIRKLSKDYYLYPDTWKNNYSELLTVPGFILPIHQHMVCFGHFGDKYIMYVLQSPLAYGESGWPADSSYDGNYVMGYVFSDLEDIAGSIDRSQIFYGLDIKTVKYSTDTKSGFIKLGGYAPIGSKTSYNNGFYDMNIGSKYVSNRSNTSQGYSYGKRIDGAKAGLWVNDVSQHGNCYSIRVLDTPVEKLDTSKLYVSYGYSR